jgi:hypothetical protein
MARQRRRLATGGRRITSAAAILSALGVGGCGYPPQNITCGAVRALRFGMPEFAVRDLLGPPVSVYRTDAVRGRTVHPETTWFYQTEPSLFMMSIAFFEDKLVRASISRQPLPYFQWRSLYVVDETGVFEKPAFRSLFRCP